ncbi:hypothetical protein ACFL22_00785 [Patescibacteria group bacterium]
MKSIEINCDRCKENHTYQISKEHIKSGKVFNFACIKIKRLPRVTSLRIDFTKNTPTSLVDDKAYTTSLYGVCDIDNKVARKNQINTPKLWLVHDFDQYFEEIIKSYIVGSYYPVATSCTTLAERLINLFIIKMRDLYPTNILDTDLQKYVYTRDQNWQSFDLNIKVLDAWGILNPDQKKWFKDLLDIRNRAVHFQPSFNPQKDSLDAIKTLHKIIDSYFSPYERKDVIRLFEIPGEIWVREDRLADPFVRAFVLPCCNDRASCGSMNRKNVYHEKDAVIGDFSENDFIVQRKKHQPDIDYAPTYKKIRIGGKEITYRTI